jgi:hypothetical protein
MASGSDWRGGSGGTTGEKNRRDAYNELPTNAKSVENMNEAQLGKEISRIKKRIGSYDKVMAESQKRTQFERMDRIVDKATSYTSAYSKKQSAEKKLTALQKAKKQVSGTGKTQSQLSRETRAAAIKNNSGALKWKTTNKGGYTQDGGYMSKEISAGGFKIRGSSGVFRIYDGSKQIGGASKLSDAKAFVEIWRKRR